MRIRLGGVPEHFNYLWQSAGAREVFRNNGYYLEWQEFSGGTGAMATALENDAIDIAIMLTEGAVSQIAAGMNFGIMFPFVMSPLLWGVFTSTAQKKKNNRITKDSKFAISRFYSGSHLMAIFLAKRYNVVLSSDNFVLSNDLAGARKALSSGEADFFLWEKYMTKPLVHNGEFDMEDEVSAPWPAFCFVCKRNSAMPGNEKFWPLVQSCIRSFYAEPTHEIVNELATAYEITENDAGLWLEKVRYYDGNNYWKDRVLTATIIMQNAGMINELPSLNTLLF